ncbi:MAG: hypothetical protein U0228_04730 [Myxococcaceae bacterium]
MAQQPNATRALVWGLIAALVVCAVVMGVFSLQSATVDCDFPGTEQCAFDQETGRELARLQALASLGLVCIGGGLFFFARKPK